MTEFDPSGGSEFSNVAVGTPLRKILYINVWRYNGIFSGKKTKYFSLDTVQMLETSSFG